MTFDGQKNESIDGVSISYDDVASSRSRPLKWNDVINAVRTGTTRIFTNFIYSVFDSQQEDYIKSKKDGAETPARLSPLGKFMGRVADGVGGVSDNLLERLVLRPVARARSGGDKDKEEVIFKELHEEYCKYEGGISTGEKFGRTAWGFFGGALANNAQRTLIRVFDKGEHKPWVDENGNARPVQFARWTAQEAFRAVFKGAGEDVFASLPQYTIAGKKWIRFLQRFDKQLNPDNYDVQTGEAIANKKSLFLHAGEWQGKFYLYNVFTNMWRDIYDFAMKPIERLIGGNKNNPDEAPAEQKSIGEKIRSVGRWLIRTPIKQFAPMMCSTPAFWLPGYFSTTLASQLDDPNYQPKGVVDEIGRKFGKMVNNAGIKIDDIIAYAQEKGIAKDQNWLEGMGQYTAKAYSRYSMYFVLKEFFQNKYANKSADFAIDRSIDGFTGMISSALTLNFKGVRQNWKRLREGAGMYAEVLKFKEEDLLELVKEIKEFTKNNQSDEQKTEKSGIAHQKEEEKINTPSFTIAGKTKGAQEMAYGVA